MQSLKAYLFTVLSLFSLLLIGCDFFEPQSSDVQSNINDPVEGYKRYYDVKYGRYVFNDMDIHTPITPYNSPAEVVIILHGGNWTQGEKWFLQPSVDSLIAAKKNLAIVNINYRLAAEPNKTLFETQMNDIDSCLTYLQRNSERYNIRSDKFAIMGASAGGHLALSFAYIDKGDRIHTAIGMSSITELTVKELSSVSIWHDIQVMAGQNYNSVDNSKLRAASPVYLAHPRAPKTLLMYGGKDGVVYIRQQTLLKERLQALRVPNALYVFPDENHNISAGNVSRGILTALGASEYDTYLKKIN